MILLNGQNSCKVSDIEICFIYLGSDVKCNNNNMTIYYLGTLILYLLFLYQFYDFDIYLLIYLYLQNMESRLNKFRENAIDIYIYTGKERIYSSVFIINHQNIINSKYILYC